MYVSSPDRVFYKRIINSPIVESSDFNKKLLLRLFKPK